MRPASREVALPGLTRSPADLDSARQPGRHIEVGEGHRACGPLRDGGPDLQRRHRGSLGLQDEASGTRVAVKRMLPAAACDALLRSRRGCWPDSITAGWSTFSATAPDARRLPRFVPKVFRLPHGHYYRVQVLYGWARGSDSSTDLCGGQWVKYYQQYGSRTTFAPATATSSSPGRASSIDAH